MAAGMLIREFKASSQAPSWMAVKVAWMLSESASNGLIAGPSRPIKSPLVGEAANDRRAS